MTGRFRRLLAASAVSNLGDGVGRAALPLLAATLTRDPVLISGVYSLSYLPWLLFALPAGVLVDRSDRRRAMIVANSVRAATVAALAVAVATGHASIVLLYTVAFAIGLAETVYDSAANALLPRIVRADQLDAANSRLVTAEAVGQVFLGGPVGAALFTVAAAAPFVTNAAGFALCALLMATLTGSYRPLRASTRTLRRDVADGVRWMGRNPLLSGLTVLFGLASAAQAMVLAVLVLYVLDVLRLGPTAYGVLLLAGGVGGLIGGLVAPALARWPGRTAALSLANVAAPACLVAMALADRPAVAMVLFGTGGLWIMVGNVISMSLRQAIIPEELFGRVQGVWRTAVWGGIPLGGLAGGVLAGHAGIPAVLLVAGAAGVAIGVAVTVLLIRHRPMITAAYAPADTPAPVAPVAPRSSD